MTLRRKLLTVFGGLALLACLVAGVTVWATLRWNTSDEVLRHHYVRSIILQRIRATTFEAFKEVPDALFAEDLDARRDFAEALAPAGEDFAAWRRRVDTREELAEFDEVRRLFDGLIRDADRAFDLIEAGDRRAAVDLVERRIEDEDYAAFQRATERAALRDRERRRAIRAAVDGVRHTTQVVLALAAFATLSLSLLLFGYLASDLFRPLGRVVDALKDLARGDARARLDGERDDEIGAVNRAFNKLAEALGRRERAAVASGAVGEGRDGEVGERRDATSREALHALVVRLRGRLHGLRARPDGDGRTEAALVEAEELMAAVARLAEFGFPLDLNLADTDLRALLYEVLLRFHDELARRSIAYEIDVPPDLGPVAVDRLKLRESLGEVFRNALAALPERGGRIGLRAAVDRERDQVRIEVADDGRGMDEGLVDRALGADPFGGGARASGPALVRAMAERHGGRLKILSKPGAGTVVRMALPLRA